MKKYRYFRRGIAAIMLSLMLVIVGIPMTAQEAYAAETLSSSSTHTLTDDWTLTIKSNSFTYGDVSSSYRANVRKIIFTSDVTTITTTMTGGQWENPDSWSRYPPAFEAVEEIEIKNGVMAIGEAAFANYVNLEKVTVPASVDSIGQAAFWRTSITSIMIPGPVTQLKKSTFYGCGRLKSVTLPTSLHTIGPYAFFNCDSLVSISLPENITSIDEYAFKGSEALKSITIPKGVTTISNNTFQDCIGLTSVTLPSSLTTIGEYAFDGTSLSSITFPKTLNSIGQYAFQNCERLKTIRFNGPTAPSGIKKQTGYPYTETAFLNVQGDAYYPYSGRENLDTLESRFTDITWHLYNVPMSATTVSGVSSSYNYTGKAITPTPTVKYDGTTLKKGTDYTVAYKNNTEIGTATITLTGKGNYTGTKSVTFKIASSGKTGLIKQSSGKYHLYKYGVFQSSYSGLYKNNSGKYAVIKNGVWQNTFNGLYKSPVTGKVLYITNGYLDTSVTRMVKNSNGNWLYIKNGYWQNGYSGLYLNQSGKYMVIKNGVWQNGYNGLYKSPASGKVLYITNGYFDPSVNKLVKNSNGKYLLMRGGVWQKDYTGNWTSSVTGKKYKIVKGIAQL